MKREEVAGCRPQPGARPFSLAASRPASSPARFAKVRSKSEEVANYRPQPGAVPFSLAAARPASSPASGGGSHGCNAHQASGSGKRSRGHKFAPPAPRAYERPASERADGDAGASQVCTKLAPCLPPCTKPSYRSTGPSSSAPKPLLLLHPGALLFFSAEKKRRGPKFGQDNRSMPCRRKK